MFKQFLDSEHLIPSWLKPSAEHRRIAASRRLSAAAVRGRPGIFSRPEEMVPRPITPPPSPPPPKFAPAWTLGTVAEIESAEEQTDRAGRPAKNSTEDVAYPEEKPLQALVCTSADDLVGKIEFSWLGFRRTQNGARGTFYSRLSALRRGSWIKGESGKAWYPRNLPAFEDREEPESLRGVRRSLPLRDRSEMDYVWESRWFEPTRRHAE
ncbi:hypothetical protein FB451DRAFT_1370468 [Mycena latifolia]|nr:hypothetical protein FB451DRAFT_1370468 [Mycena latifolia]